VRGVLPEVTSSQEYRDLLEEVRDRSSGGVLPEIYQESGIQGLTGRGKR
jgi:hypothetical protein